MPIAAVMFTVTDSVLLRNKFFIAPVMYQSLSKVNEPDMIASNSNIINHYTRSEKKNKTKKKKHLLQKCTRMLSITTCFQNCHLER